MAEFQSFHKLAKILVQVPKSEIDDLLAKKRKKKAQAKNGHIPKIQNSVSATRGRLIHFRTASFGADSFRHSAASG